MGKKRKVFVHVGLDDEIAETIGLALVRHEHALLELGVRCPARSREELFRAAVEILRTHAEWGYRRSEVEGTWADLCERAWAGRDTIVVSQSLLAAARPEQIDLLVDRLRGFEVHVVVTTRAPDSWTSPGDAGRDLASVLERWPAAVRSPERLHVIVADDAATAWRRFGRVVGFGTASLGVDDLAVPVRHRVSTVVSPAREDVVRRLGSTWSDVLRHSEVDVVGDLAVLVPTTAPSSPAVATEAGQAATERALSEALLEIERLSRSNENLRTRIAALEAKNARRKAKKARKRGLKEAA